MKRTISVILITTILFSMFFAETAVSGESPKESIAEAVLAEQGFKSEFGAMDFGKAGSEAEVVQKGGAHGWQMNKQKAREDSCISISLEKPFKNERDGSVYVVDVEYFDEGKGFFNLTYDSLDEEAKLADVVYLKNTAMWKTAEFTLDDALFENRLAGKYDMQLGVYEVGSNVVSDSSVVVRRVSVKRIFGKNPVFVSSETNRPGNSYEWFAKSKTINNTFDNLTDKSLDLNVEYVFEGVGGYVALEKTEKLTLFLQFGHSSGTVVPSSYILLLLPSLYSI